MRRRLGALVAVLVVFAAPGVAASAAFAGEFTTDEAYAGGAVHVSGDAWVARVQMERDLPPPAAAILYVEGADVEVRVHYREFVGVHQVGTFAIQSEPRTETDELGAARLSLAEARQEAQAMITSLPAGHPFQVDASAESARFRAETDVDVALFEVGPASQPPEELNRTYERSAQAVRADLDGVGAATIVSGDFALLLWDLDVVNEAEGGGRYESGTRRHDGVGASPAMPDGAVFQARLQLVEVLVQDGSVAFALPQRPLEVHLGSAPALIETEGAWELPQASGRVQWGEASAEAGEEPVRLEGRFEVRLSATEDGALQGTWTGEATRVRTDGEVAAPAAAVLPSGASSPLWVLAGVAVLGVGALGAASTFGGRAALRAWRGAHMWRPTRDDAATVRSITRVVPGGPSRALQRLVDRHMKLLGRGRADDVVGELKPGFDPKDPAARVKAYLLGLAHFELGRDEEGTQWMARAADPEALSEDEPPEPEPEPAPAAARPPDWTGYA